MRALIQQGYNSISFNILHKHTTGKIFRLKSHFSADASRQRLRCTLDLVSLKDPEEPGSQEAELSLTGVRESCNHLRHGGLPSDTGQAVIISEQEPVKHIS